MDFIGGLPKSNGKDVILVIVDRFTKYSQFLPLSHPYTVQDIIQLLSDNILKLHGPPTVIVTDRDRVFTSNFWQSLFKSMKITLHISSSYHPETDGQTERSVSGELPQMHVLHNTKAMVLLAFLSRMVV